MKGTPIKQLNGLNWTPDDLTKKFAHSYVLATTTQYPNPAVFFIDSPADGGKALITPKDLKSYFCFHKDFFVIEDRPPICTTNVGENNAVVFRYNPERQWRRGVGTFNCFFYMAPTLRLYDGKGLGWDTADAVFKPSYSTLDDALKQFRANDKLVGRAIKGAGNAQYLLTRDGPKAPINLYRDRTLMGSFTGTKFFTVQEAGRLFSAELTKELPALRESYAFTKRAA